MSAGLNINANMMTWAVDRAGFDLQEFIGKYPKLEHWLNGTKQPTLKQLEEFSKKVYLPFGYLLLPEPPKEALPMPFFRTNRKATQKVSINVYDTVLMIQQRQEWLSDYLQENDFEPVPFVGRFTADADVQLVVDDIRQTLGLARNWASYCSNWQNALDRLTQRIEGAGVNVSFNGVVGNSTNRAISVDECRGFVLVDKYAPFMFVNNADSKAAQLFTIAHEVAHVWLGESAGFDMMRLQPADDPTESFCNAVAAELLVPTDLFNEVWDGDHGFARYARFFKVSELVIARRALDTGKISRQRFFAFYKEYILREFTKKKEQDSGGNFYATTKKRIGLLFATHVNQAVKSGSLFYRDAYRLTGLKGDTFQTFFTQHL
ncbi:ImmA/IrrE family metallo-endopeptidase [Flaviaesturariibacter amylovorans]|uniref:ImmA/IrrE family metallo-endopeptidase n=1 Tax=Flaviaesturariibacter amylovorans TaxID=1084520 RepID=A0ABP8HAU2_9BACT